MKKAGRLVTILFQIVVDVIVGMAIYYGLNTFIPSLGNNVIFTISLIATAIFAEGLEVKTK